MTALLTLHHRGCFFVIHCLLWLAVVVDDHHRRLARRVKRWQKRVRSVYERWLRWCGLLKPPPYQRGRHPWNKTLEHVEEQVVRLHVEHPHLGAGQLGRLAERVLGFAAARETFRQILIRRRALVVALEGKRREPARRIDVARPRQLWGADLTLVWLFGIVPVWLLGIVDYRGSRLLMLERMRLWPTAAQVADAFERAITMHGAPERLLTDRAPIMRGQPVERLLAAYSTRHVLIKPLHAWTNGRIERVFRTYKETVFRHAGLWLFRSTAQIERYSAEFVTFYNRDRPHSAYGGRTPDEVYFERPARRAAARVSYFDDRLHAYRLG